MVCKTEMDKLHTEMDAAQKAYCARCPAREFRGPDADCGDDCGFTLIMRRMFKTLTDVSNEPDDDGPDGDDGMPVAA